MGMSANQLALVRYVAENNIRKAKEAALCCCAEDTTQKNHYAVARYQQLLRSGGMNLFELPANISSFATMEDLTNTYLENRYFSPIYDFPDAAVNAIYHVYGIEEPALYHCVRRSGCIGCPYINDIKRIEQDLALATPNQRAYIIQLFKESYDVKGVNYEQFLNNGIYIDTDNQFTLSDYFNHIRR